MDRRGGQRRRGILPRAIVSAAVLAGLSSAHKAVPADASAAGARGVAGRPAVASGVGRLSACAESGLSDDARVIRCQGDGAGSASSSAEVRVRSSAVEVVAADIPERGALVGGVAGALRRWSSMAKAPRPVSRRGQCDIVRPLLRPQGESGFEAPYSETEVRAQVIRIRKNSLNFALLAVYRLCVLKMVQEGSGPLLATGKDVAAAVFIMYDPRPDELGKVLQFADERDAANVRRAVCTHIEELCQEHRYVGDWKTALLGRWAPQCSEVLGPGSAVAAQHRESQALGSSIVEVEAQDPSRGPAGGAAADAPRARAMGRWKSAAVKAQYLRKRLAACHAVRCLLRPEGEPDFQARYGGVVAAAQDDGTDRIRPNLGKPARLAQFRECVLTTVQKKGGALHTSGRHLGSALFVMYEKHPEEFREVLHVVGADAASLRQTLCSHIENMCQQHNYVGQWKAALLGRWAPQCEHLLGPGSAFAAQHSEAAKMAAQAVADKAARAAEAAEEAKAALVAARATAAEAAARSRTSPGDSVAQAATKAAAAPIAPEGREAAIPAEVAEMTSAVGAAHEAVDLQVHQDGQASGADSPIAEGADDGAARQPPAEGARKELGPPRAGQMRRACHRVDAFLRPPQQRERPLRKVPLRALSRARIRMDPLSVENRDSSVSLATGTEKPRALYRECMQHLVGHTWVHKAILTSGEEVEHFLFVVYREHAPEFRALVGAARKAQLQSLSTGGLAADDFDRSMCGHMDGYLRQEGAHRPYHQELCAAWLDYCTPVLQAAGALQGAFGLCLPGGTTDDAAAATSTEPPPEPQPAFFRALAHWGGAAADTPLARGRS